MSENMRLEIEDALGGRTINGVPNNPYSTASQLVVDYLCTHWNSDPKRATFLTSNNLALPAERFHTLGGFDASWKRAAGEDRELCDRWISRGYWMMYVPDAVVEHFYTLTWRTFFSQHFNYGRGALYFRRASASRHQGSGKTEPAQFYLGVLRYPLSQARASKALVFAALIMGAQVANAAGFFWESAKRMDANDQNCSAPSVLTVTPLCHETAIAQQPLKDSCVASSSAGVVPRLIGSLARGRA